MSNPSDTPRILALVPCAGSGSRAGTAMPKQYQPVAGRAMLWHALVAFAQAPSVDASLLVLAPGLTESDEHRQWLREAGFIARGTVGWCSAVLDLTQDAATLRKRLASTWRTQLNGAERGGLEFEISDKPCAFDWMLARHQENMRDKGFAGTSPDFLRALRERAPEDVFVCRALHDGQPLAGMIVFRFARSAEYFVGWFGPEARQKKAGNFLMWNAALTMQARGCERFDLGGYSSSDGYGRFKQGLRGSEYRLLEEWVAF